MKQIGERIKKLEAKTTAQSEQQPVYTMTPDQALAVADILLEVGGVELLQVCILENKENERC